MQLLVNYRRRWYELGFVVVPIVYGYFWYCFQSLNVENHITIWEKILIKFLSDIFTFSAWKVHMTATSISLGPGEILMKDANASIESNFWRLCKRQSIQSK
uniref:Uncharacterized protein n=1 Tax=Oryza brachyantha TaxID=4533 RepID=J3NCT6_ORYBR